jgi:diadenosine tetraphosphate (Ap4A) HIT family hydrolase
MFHLHPRLQADTVMVRELPLSLLLLSNDARYPWFILVPRREAIQEIYELDEADQHQLWHESSCLGKAAMQAFGGDKLNIGALGNLVPQLHLHHIVRFRNDESWPGPVWGKGQAQPYTPAAREAVIQRLLSAMAV